MSLTDEELAELRRVTDAASPGPWEIWSGNPWHAKCGGAESLIVQSGSGGPVPQDKANIAFCAAAREAMPRLLDEIARLRQVAPCTACGHAFEFHQAHGKPVGRYLTACSLCFCEGYVAP